eukprot:507977_1
MSPSLTTFTVRKRVSSAVMLMGLAFFLSSMFILSVHSRLYWSTTEYASPIITYMQKHQNETSKHVITRFPRPVSKELILTTLSNKTIIFFGDSLLFYLVSYLINVLYYCIKNTPIPASLDCNDFCHHLNLTNQIITHCGQHLLRNRSLFEHVVQSFSEYNVIGDAISFPPTELYMYDQEYNITIRLYYKWALHLKTTEEMIQETIKYKYDIMINNLMNMHIPLTIRPNGYWNKRFALDMIHNMEHIISDMIDINAKHCDDCILLLGPVNPVTNNIDKKYNSDKINKRRLKKWKRLQYKYLLRSNNISIDASIDIVGITAYLRSKDALMHYLQMKQSPFRGIAKDTPLISHCVNELNALDACLWYRWTFGNNIIHHRIKRYLLSNEHEHVRYHNQYEIYSPIVNLSDYAVDDVHYPRLLPLAWKNIFNLMGNLTNE